MIDAFSMFKSETHSKTAAGFGNSSFHIASISDGFFSAIALTEKSSHAGFGIKGRKDDKFSEALVGEIDTFGHMA
jgi:hypothetical protein